MSTLDVVMKVIPSLCFFLQPKAVGQALLSEVFLRGNLIESDYFGLEFQNMQMNWVRTAATAPLASCLKQTHIEYPAALSSVISQSVALLYRR